MDTLVIVVLIALVAGLLLSGQRSTPEPQFIYVVTTPEQSSGGVGCLLPLIFIGFVLFILFAAQ
jgi:hypothetical protein